ncbi:MAG: beta-lactamase [Spirosoma sp.]|nr:beta-lactamase [Spirosoma sp.]
MAPDFSTQEEIFGKLLGPMPTNRAATNGIILRHGYIVAEWGDTQRPDPTYSVAKSVLSTVVGISVERGLIPDIHQPVALLIHDGGYESAQNQGITWEHHLQQTSEWQGELWGKNSDFVGKEAFGKGERKPRQLQPPGNYYEYNDVRINRMALSLLRLWKKPIPDVVRDEIMNPIGASDTWQYITYPNAIADIDGKTMPSVSGGTRWGGGLRISAAAADRPRSGPVWLLVWAAGTVGKPADCFDRLGQTGYDAQCRWSGLWLLMVAEYGQGNNGQKALARCTDNQFCSPWCRTKHRLGRPRT